MSHFTPILLKENFGYILLMPSVSPRKFLKLFTKQFALTLKNLLPTSISSFDELKLRTQFLVSGPSKINQTRVMESNAVMMQTHILYTRTPYLKTAKICIFITTCCGKMREKSHDLNRQI